MIIKRPIYPGFLRRENPYSYNYWRESEGSGVVAGKMILNIMTGRVRLGEL